MSSKTRAGTAARPSSSTGARAPSVMEISPSVALMERTPSLASTRTAESSGTAGRLPGAALATICRSLARTPAFALTFTLGLLPLFFWVEQARHRDRNVAGPDAAAGVLDEPRPGERF